MKFCRPDQQTDQITIIRQRSSLLKQTCDQLITIIGRKSRKIGLIWCVIPRIKSGRLLEQIRRSANVLEVQGT